MTFFCRVGFPALFCQFGKSHTVRVLGAAAHDYADFFLSLLPAQQCRGSLDTQASLGLGTDEGAILRKTKVNHAAQEGARVDTAINTHHGASP